MNIASGVKLVALLGLATAFSAGAFGQTVELWSTNLGGAYDDSWQPPSCEWKNEGIFGLPSLHCGRPRALRHELKLVVRGPNDESVRQAVNSCIRDGAIAGVVTGVTAAVVTSGLAGAGVAVQNFLKYVAACVGEYAAQGISASVDDNSHWVEY